MNPRLRVEVGIQADLEYEIPLRDSQGAVWLGRGAFCLIRIADHQISRRQCEFSYDGDRLFVKDLGTRNGTRVNDLLIQNLTELRHGDRITAGSTQLVVVWPSADNRQRAVMARLGTEEELSAAYREVAALAGSDFAGYHLGAVLSDGVTSCVLQARDSKRNIPAAVKVLKPLERIGVEDKNRFVYGARLGASLRHHNFVRVFKGGHSRGLYFTAMEFYRGRNLERMVEEMGGPLATKPALDIVDQVLEGLEYAHEQGIVFGGVYPDNVIVGDRLKIKLTDFDLVRRAVPRGGADAAVGGAEGLNLHVKRSFAAPEQIAYPAVSDPRSDVFGAGALLYYMLCGRPPFDEELPGAQLTTAFDRVLNAPRSISPTIPAAIARVIKQSMSEYSRFATAEEMRHALREASSGIST